MLVSACATHPGGHRSGVSARRREQRRRAADRLRLLLDSATSPPPGLERWNSGQTVGSDHASLFGALQTVVALLGALGRDASHRASVVTQISESLGVLRREVAFDRSQRGVWCAHFAAQLLDLHALFWQVTSSSGAAPGGVHRDQSTKEFPADLLVPEQIQKERVQDELEVQESLAPSPETSCCWSMRPSVGTWLAAPPIFRCLTEHGRK